MKRRKDNIEIEIPSEDDEGTVDSISKSQRKRDMIALQDVGETLVELSPETLRKFELPDDLLTALLEAKKIAPSKHGGRKRQMQYIGKLMRNVDAEPIIKRLAELRAPSDQQTAFMHLAEQWRERLLADTDAENQTLGLFINDFPDADRVLLLRYVAASRDERAKQKPPKHYRLLYQEIHRMVLEKASATY